MQHEESASDVLLQQISLDIHSIKEKTDNIEDKVHGLAKDLAVQSTQLAGDHKSLKDLVEREDETLRGRVAIHGKEIDDLKTENTGIRAQIGFLKWALSIGLPVMGALLAAYITLKGG